MHISFLNFSCKMSFEPIFQIIFPISLCTGILPLAYNFITHLVQNYFISDTNYAAFYHTLVDNNMWIFLGHLWYNTKVINLVIHINYNILFLIFVASIIFLGDSQPADRKALAVYPIFLFYFVISWLVISNTNT